MKYTIIYIPGLFDKRKFLRWLQRQLLRSWRAWSMQPELFPMWWDDRAETYEKRFNELLARIDELSKEGTVILAGASAGASAALHAFAERSETVHAMISICGELKGTEKVPKAALQANPRFKKSLELMEKSIKKLKRGDKARILALRPRVDAVVQPDEAFLRGAENVHMPIVGHLAGIGFAILFEARRIKRFITR